MKAVILDSYALHQGDLDWSPIHKMVDEVISYPRTKPEEIIARLADADVAIVNKSNINEAVLAACPNLKWIGVTSTGVDSLDIAACRRHNIPVSNVPAYSTHSVAQLTFALLLSLCQSPGEYDRAVRAGHWQLDIPAAFSVLPHQELCGKTMGLVGFGAIAQQVAIIAKAFGMQVLCHTRTVRPAYATTGVEFMSLDSLLAASDVISLHCPCTPQTQGIIDAQALARCKPTAILLNTARGLLVDEAALAQALHNNKLRAFGTDVASREPMAQDNPLLHAPRTLITPHIAWATPEALGRLAHTVCGNLSSFLAGNPENVIN